MRVKTHVVSHFGWGSFIPYGYHWRLRYRSSLILAHPGVNAIRQILKSPDLYRIYPVASFSLHQTLDSPENLKEKTTKLCYDFEKRRVFLFGSQVLVKHSEWAVRENITSVSDLIDTMVVIDPTTFTGIIKLDEIGSGSRFIEESQVATEISKTTTLIGVNLKFSSGKVLTLQSNKLERIMAQGKLHFVYTPD